MKKRLNKKSIQIISTVVFFVLIFIFFPDLSQAEDCSDSCKTKCAIYIVDSEEFEDCKEKCEDECNALDKKARIIKQNLKINEQTQNLLGNQLAYINQQQSSNQQKLSTIQTKLDDLKKNISNLERDITEKEKTINYQKKILAGLIRSYYDYDQQGVLDFVLMDKEFSDSMSQKDYVEQSGTKMSDILQEIKEAQKN